MQDKLALLSLSIAIGGLIIGAFDIYLTTRQEREAREMQHRERMAALEKGIDSRLPRSGPPGTRAARSGARRDRAGAAWPDRGVCGVRGPRGLRSAGAPVR